MQDPKDRPETETEPKHEKITMNEEEIKQLDEAALAEVAGGLPGALVGLA